ncbi:helix-turn-helix domain-containing protein [Streptomyces sp. NBC_01732]|uniref:helix-turn-helix domain-containing protein n=1 Tax=Streptomyces sp. NBC_01732 TaxID=2975926 RepID=UPI00352BF609
MGQQPRELTPNASPWHRWGYELRETRKARGMSLQGLSELALCDKAHLGRFERAERPVPRAIALTLDDKLNAGGALVRGWDRANEDQPSATATHGTSGAGARSHEAKARSHEAKPMSALATSTFGQAGSDGDDTDTVVVPCRRPNGRIFFVPVPRRTVLASAVAGFAAMAVPAPVTPSNALSAGMKSPAEHYTQLRRVMIQTDNLIGPRHVLPAIQQHLATLAARRRTARGIDGARLLELETRYEELAGWLAQDIGDDRAAYGHTARALDASHMTGDHALTAYILGRKAQLAVDTGHAADALGLAAAARRTARPGSRLEVIAVMHQAHAHAALGDEADAFRDYDTALALLDAADDDGAWGSWLDVPYIHTTRARSYAALGRYDQAADGFQSALAALPATYRRDRGVYLARAARAHAGAGDHARAAETGLQAVGIAAETGSARIIGQLDKLDQTLSAAPREPGVAEFRAALDRIVLHLA